jgi:hypothetical protein
LSQVHLWQTQQLVQPVMTQHHRFRLILKVHLKQLLLRLIPQLRLLPLPVHWLQPQPLLPVLLPQLVPQLVLPVEWVAVQVAVPVVVDHRLHQVMVVAQKAPKAKKAKVRESQNL